MAAAGLAAATLLPVGPASHLAAPAGAAGPTTSKFVAMTPTRIIDTRVGQGTPRAPLPAATTVDFVISGTGTAIPAGATAAVLNVTATNTAGPGWLQVVPTGAAVGSTSTLNISDANQTVAASVFAPLDQSGSIQAYSTVATDLVVDVSGYFVPAATSASGRFVAVSPTRVLDTRSAIGWGGRLGATKTATVKIAGQAGVPTSGVTAVVLNVTADDPGGNGWVQVAPRPISPGASSSLNVSQSRTVANLVVVPLGLNGQIELYTTAATDLLADVEGYFTDASSAVSSDGLFVPVSPSRQLDTRIPSGSARLGSGANVTIDVSDVGGVMSAVTGSIVAVVPDAGGWAQLSPAPIDPGAFSTLNAATNLADVANGFVSPVGAGGTLQVLASRPMHLVVDVTGWFTGPPLVRSIPGTTAFALGDIATCSASQVDDRIGAYLAATDPSAPILMLGDNVYDNGSAAEYANCFNPIFGGVKSRIRPVAGNHEYQTPNATGYYGYFGAIAGNPTQGWYSYDIGAWHVVALNANCGDIGGCGTGSPQYQWLQADLAAHPAACTIAQWHQPRFSSGEHNNDAEVQPLWQALYDGNADIVLNGHDHDYERFSPQTPTGASDAVRGIREFVVGTGEAAKRAWGAIRPNSEVRDGAAHGVLELVLGGTGYSWQFHDTDRNTVTDSGLGSCH